MVRLVAGEYAFVPRPGIVRGGRVTRSLVQGGWTRC